MPAPFANHVELLNAVLDRRAVIIDTLERQALNVQHKDTSRRRDRAHFERLVHGAVYGVAGLPRNLTPLAGSLAAAHVEDGFRPVLPERQAHTLDPLELLIRAYDYWDATRWPGRNGRTTFAQALFSVFFTCQLELLTMRAWDDGGERARERLRAVQELLDRLNDGPGACVFVRDARWLLQTAQGPLTSDLAPYFRVAERIATTIDERYRLEIHRAGVVLAAGHLRSQQRYRSLESGRSATDPEVLAITRNSNTMDAALLVWDLVAVLEAYQSAVDTADAATRKHLADAVLQGVSADPELFLTRVDLLGAATIVEDVFVTPSAMRTAAGQRHAAALARYRQLIEALREPLADDCRELDPAGRAYSPLGISYGFCADVLWNVALSVLTSQPATDLALEDLFESRRRLDDKSARARVWESLPIHGGETEHFTHSTAWAQQVFDSVLTRLQREERDTRSGPTARLFVVRDDGEPPSQAEDIPAGTFPAQEHLITSDVQRALASGATAFPKSHILADRKEGRYLASVEHDGKWFAVSKVVLTACLARGKDAVMTGVPAALVERLQATIPDLIALPARSASPLES